MTVPRRSNLDKQATGCDEWLALQEALRCAHSPSALPEWRHSQIIEAAICNPMDTPSAEELERAEQLSLALDGLGEHPDVALADALRAAWNPVVEANAATAVGQQLTAFPETERRHVVSHPTGPVRTQAVVIRLFFLTSAAAAAAALVLALRPSTPSTSPPELYEARSSASLFDTEFRQGEASIRVDRVASIRARELRQNRFALWGVK